MTPQSPSPDELGAAAPDLRVLILAAEQDPAAEATLYALTQRVIEGALGKWPSAIGYDRDNVISEVTMRLVMHKFNPSWPLPEGTPPDQEAELIEVRYRSYIGKIVRSVIVDGMVPSQREESSGSMEDVATADALPPPESVRAAETYVNVNATAALPDELLKKHLTKKQYAAMRLLQEGKDYREVAEILDINTVASKALIYRLRRRIEERILTPNGLIRVIEPGATQPLGHKIRAGQLPAVKILGFWYMREADLPRKTVSPETHLALAHIATMGEVVTFRRIYPDRIIVEGGRSYIRTADLPLLEEVKAAKKAHAQPIPAPPKEGYAAIQELAANASEAAALAATLRRSNVFSDSIRHQQHTYIPRAEAEVFLRALREQRTGNTEDQT